MSVVRRLGWKLGLPLVVGAAIAVYVLLRAFGPTVAPQDVSNLAGSQLAIVTAVAHNSSDGVVTTVPVGTNVHIKATVAGAFGTPTGTVRVEAYDGGTCSGFIQGESNATALSGGTADVTSFPWSTLVAGSMSFIVRYGGNDTYAATAGACIKVTVTKVASTVQLVIHNPSHQVVTDVPIGTSIHTRVAASGAKGVPTGNVQVSWWSNGTCSGDAPGTFASVPLVNGAIDITTQTLAVTDFGTNSYRARYAGNETYTAANSPCVPYTVVKAQPTINGSVHEPPHEPQTAVAVGTVVHPAATLSGGAGTPTGNVEVLRYAGATCSGGPTISYHAAAAVMDPVADGVTRDTPGSYSWRFHYLGDGRYTERTSNCYAMRWKALPTITAIVHDAPHNTVSSVPPNSAVHLRVTVGTTGSGGTPTGNVSVYFYSGGACPGNGGINLGTGALVSGVLDDVDIDRFLTTAGTYQLVATYQGDSTYAAKVGSCVTFTVANPATPTPTPTIAPTPKPTATPKPTGTPTPKPTATPVPGASGQPNATSEPNATSNPATTAEPAATPGPSVAPEPGSTSTTGPDATPASTAGSLPGSSAGPDSTPGATGAPAPGDVAGSGDSGWGVWLLLLLVIALVIGGAWFARRRRAQA